MRKLAHRPLSSNSLDVAIAANVTKSTGSLVLQSCDLVPAETSVRLRDAAARIASAYTGRAANIRRQSCDFIGVVVNNLWNPLLISVLIGLERKLVDAGYSVFIAHTNEDLDKQQKLLKAMKERGAAGIAVCPALGTPASLTDTVKAWDIPLVVMIRTLGAGNCDFSGADNTLGVRHATNHLIAKGHRHVAFLGGVRGPVLEQRIDGYKAALAYHNIEFDPALVLSTSPTREGGRAAMIKLLKLQKSVRAVMCYDDATAFGALSALDGHGLRAGTDFEVMGFGNLFEAAYSNPPLSTVDIKPDTIGEEAAAQLLARINDPKLRVQRYIQSPELVFRQSA